jgi:hypothetical protein
LTKRALAAWLGMDVDGLLRLAACPLPDRRAPDFPRQVRRLSAYASCDVVRLVLLLTEPAQDHEMTGSAHRTSITHGVNGYV